jgi:thiol-disulfide isomerase/thioredoxin
LKDKAISQLSDFKGKLVLLNFWGTYCSPCIRSIPDKNKLAEDFKKEEFVLINICTDSNFELWRQIIRNNEFKGVHLICKGNWNDLLRSGYNIFSLPHYTIIDQNGRILMNNVRDSVEYFLKAYLYP